MACQLSPWISAYIKWVGNTVNEPWGPKCADDILLPVWCSQLRWLILVQQLLSNGLPYCGQRWQRLLLVLQLPFRVQRHRQWHRDLH